MRRSSDRLIWSGLLLLSEALSFEVDAVCIVDEAIEDCVGDGGIQPLRYLHDCSDCFRLERLPGGIFTHWKAPPLHGAHPFRKSATFKEISIAPPSCLPTVTLPPPIFEGGSMVEGSSIASPCSKRSHPHRSHRWSRFRLL